MKKIILASLVGFVTLSSVGVGSVGAEEIRSTNTDATITFENGKLSFISANDEIDFGSNVAFEYGKTDHSVVTIDGDPVVTIDGDPVEGKEFTLTFTDDRVGKSHKWDLKAKAEGSMGESKALIDGTLISFGTGETKSSNGYEDYKPNFMPKAEKKELEIIVNNNSEVDRTVTVLSANRSDLDNQGIGTWSLGFDASNIELTIGSLQKAQMSAEAGTYSTIITWTLSDGI